MPDFQDLFTQATELVELGRLDEALALFQTLLKTDSNNPTIWNIIGIILFRQGEYREAVNAFGQAADTDPEFTDALYNKSPAISRILIFNNYPIAPGYELPSVLCNSDGKPSNCSCVIDRFSTVLSPARFYLAFHLFFCPLLTG